MDVEICLVEKNERKCKEKLHFFFCWRKIMYEKEIDIEDMQCWVFRLAQTRWKISAKECAKLFKDYDLWGFIEECYDVLHLNSYNCVVNDIETLLKNKGVKI